MELVLYPDKALTIACPPVERVDDEIKRAALVMIDLMRASGGVGLAAPQVGISRRFFVAETDGALACFVNPRIVERFGTIASDEGCLSFPGARGRVVRSAEVSVEFVDLDGVQRSTRTGGLLSVIIQHECDHLDGVLFIDRMNRHARRGITKVRRAR